MALRRSWRKWTADQWYSLQEMAAIVVVRTVIFIAATVVPEPNGSVKGGHVVPAEAILQVPHTTPLVTKMDTSASTAKLQKAGEICMSCRKFWLAQKLEPKRLVNVRKTTEKRNIAIVVCPYCDGDVIVKLNKRKP